MMHNLEKLFLDNKNKDKDIWRLFKVIGDFIDAYDELSTLPPAVSIFGSSRTPTSDIYYKTTTKLSNLLSQKGYAIITGGGRGIMEAGNKGAKVSVGLHIKLPNEHEMNKFVKISLNFRYFFTRKVTFIKYSVAFIVMPGGFGTLDELSEALCLIQTKRIGMFPIVLFGKSFFEPLEDFFRMMLKHQYIDEQDMRSYIITDCVDEAIEYIQESIVTSNNIELKRTDDEK